MIVVQQSEIRSAPNGIAQIGYSGLSKQDMRLLFKGNICSNEQTFLDKIDQFVGGKSTFIKRHRTSLERTQTDFALYRGEIINHGTDSGNAGR